MQIFDFSPVIYVAALILAAMPLLLLITFVVRGLPQRKKHLAELFTPNLKAKTLVSEGIGKNEQMTMNQFLLNKLNDVQQPWNYLLPLICFYIPYLFGLYWAFVSVAHKFTPPDGQPDVFIVGLFLPSVGFIGASLMVIGHLTWRLMRMDVQPKTIIQLSYRLFLVPPIALFASQFLLNLSGAVSLSAFVAFGIGLFPTLGLRRFGIWFTKILRQKQALLPLQHIQGLDRDDELRLWEEGITDVQQLAVATIEDLVVKTNYPLEQIIDWKDQAFLYVYVGDQLSVWRSLNNRGAMDILGLAPRFYGKSRHEEAVCALARALKQEQPIIERFINTVYHDPRVNQLWKYLESTYPTEAAQPIVPYDAEEPAPPGTVVSDSMGVTPSTTSVSTSANQISASELPSESPAAE